MSSLNESAEAKSAARTSSVTFIEEPEPRAHHYRLFSVDDHYVEPADLFTSRFAARYRHRAPHVVDGPDGGQHWKIGDETFPMAMLQTAPIGRAMSEWSMAATRYDEIRTAAWDPRARVHDMDVAGIAASLCFPSTLFGFTGRRLLGLEEPALVLEAVRAYNDWVLDEWTAAAPERFVPCQIPFLPDAEVAAEEVRRNAERGFRAISFSENPSLLGLPSIQTPAWDPLLRACEETDTVINLHVGSSSVFPMPAEDAPMPESIWVMTTVSSIFAASNWLWSRIPVRFPNVRIVFSEGGIGWVQLFYDRISKHMHPKFGHDRTQVWGDCDVTPLEAFRRNFRFACLYDAMAFTSARAIGVENIMFETDYPHADSTWPDVQDAVHAQIDHLAPHEQDLVTHGNAARLYRHAISA
jgi:predicted TIM-barrel fold metal-dependent hydrolase